MAGPLVSVEWLRERLATAPPAAGPADAPADADRPDAGAGLRVVDCRYRLGEPGAGEALWREGHIPGAAFLDLDRDLAAPPGDRGRHPLPDAGGFETAARRAGIGHSMLVVAYDEAAEGGAARLWWLLRHFGHEPVTVLDGGLRAWREEGGEMHAGEEEIAPGDFVAAPPRDDTVTAEEIAAGRATAGQAPAGGATAGQAPAGGATAGQAPAGSTTFGQAFAGRDSGAAGRDSGAAGREPILLDARAPERYRGDVEPIDPVAGHIPGAVSLPFATVAPDGRFLPPGELRSRFEAAGVRTGDAAVAYCGSGVTAAVTVLAAEVAGVGPVRLYPGSWSEWCGRGLPVERG